MRIDLIASEDWERAGEALRAAIAPPAEETLRVHAGLEPGALELALGLAQIYSHKRAIAVVKGNSPAFEQVIPWFQKEAYQVQATTWSALTAAPEAMAQWVEGLKKETAFVMAADDHPVTGELFDVDALEALLAPKRIFLIRASHSAHLFRRKPVSPYTARVGSIDAGFAVSLSGGRLRVPPLFSHRLPWESADLVARWTSRASRTEDRGAVEAIEAAFPEESFFRGVAARLHDRAVLTFADVSGEALAARAAKSASGAEVDTANLCRWNSTRLLKSWWENPPAEDVVRGLVVISPEACRRKDFAKDLRAAYEELKRLQTW